jgi:hypothetical protein
MVPTFDPAKPPTEPPLLTVADPVEKACSMLPPFAPINPPAVDEAPVMFTAPVANDWKIVPALTPTSPPPSP